HRIHHRVAVFFAGYERKEYAYAQVEAIHDDIHQNAEKNDDRPQQGQIYTHAIHPWSMTGAARVSPSVAADMGRLGVCVSPGPPSTGAAGANAAGPLRIRRKMYTVPAPNTMK